MLVISVPPPITNFEHQTLLPNKTNSLNKYAFLTGHITE